MSDRRDVGMSDSQTCTKGRKMQERTRHIIEQLASGHTQAELGRELGISRERVRQIIHLDYAQQTETAKVQPITNEHGVTNLRVIRNTKGLTLIEAGDGIGISYATLITYEHGKVIPIRRARKIADYYGVAIGEIYELAKEAI